MMNSSTGFVLTNGNGEIESLEEVESHQEGGEGKLFSLNPATGVALGEVEVTSGEQVEEIWLRAQEAQRHWRRQPLKERIRRCEELFQEVLSWRGQLLELVEDETGKGSRESRRELLKACEEIEALFEGGEEVLKARTLKRTLRGQLSQEYQPRGVALVVASAYEPLSTVLVAGIANLIAGNGVIVVAERRSPLTVTSLGNIARSLELPEGLWQTVVGGRTLVDKLAEKADLILSYGSALQARRLARAQGRRMVPLIGRWPSRDIMIVLGDGQCEAAARAAVEDGCGGGGQKMRALQRIYVQESIHDRFVDALIDELAKWRRRDSPSQGRYSVGPLLEASDLERIESLVRDATRKGARLLAGGRRRPRQKGYFYEPTILTSVDESMAIFSEEAVGPVLAITTIGAPVEAVQRSAGAESLGMASIFSESPTVASDLARRLDAQYVCINEGFASLPVQDLEGLACLDGPLDLRGVALLREISASQVLFQARRSPLREKIKKRILESHLEEEELLERKISILYRRGLARLKETFWP